MIDVLSGADVISEDPVGRQGGFPVAESVFVLVPTLVLVPEGVTFCVVVLVVTSGEAV